MKELENKLLNWYKEHGRHNLPWRKKDISPYEVWVSEIMLQQTQVNRVIEYYNNFLIKFPSIFDLAETNWEEFLPYYQGLGYYNRGKNMLKTAKIIVDIYNGEFPKDLKDLILLPGIGPYTASAILSFAYKLPYLSFDTNLHRFFGRLLHGDKRFPLKKEEIQKEFTKNLESINGAIMDFSNLVCLNRNPLCENCPFNTECSYFKEPREEISSKKKVSFPSKESQVYLFLHENHKKYYSINEKEFEPFILKAPINTRDKIKKYFKEEYNLDLSVRPPYKKEYIEKTPTLYINAQILLGDPQFKIFTKEDINKT